MSFSEIKLGYMEFHYYYMRHETHETCTNRLGLGWGWVGWDEFWFQALGFGWFWVWVQISTSACWHTHSISSPEGLLLVFSQVLYIHLLNSTLTQLRIFFLFGTWPFTMCNYIIHTSAVFTIKNEIKNSDIAPSHDLLHSSRGVIRLSVYDVCKLLPCVSQGQSQSWLSYM